MMKRFGLFILVGFRVFDASLRSFRVALLMGQSLPGDQAGQNKLIKLGAIDWAHFRGITTIAITGGGCG